MGSLVLADRVAETTTTTGTGTVTLAGAKTGYQSFAAIGNANTCYYVIAGGSEWEVGIGTYTASGTTLSRDTILASSNAGSAVSFSAGTKDVFVDVPASVTSLTIGGGYIFLRDEKPSTTTGGIPTAGVYNTRTLNTKVSDDGAHCSLASNQFTLSAGTYYIRATGPAYNSLRTRCRLRNVTDSTTILLGPSGYIPGGDMSSVRQEVVGKFTIAAGKALELQQYYQSANAGGMGVSDDMGDIEVYAVVELWKIQ